MRIPNKKGMNLFIVRPLILRCESPIRPYADRPGLQTGWYSLFHLKIEARGCVKNRELPMTD